MSGRGERERSRRDYVTRSDEWSHHGGRRNAPPSRHLWVGSLAHNLSEGTLRKHLQRFGELESVAFQPGRGYAFVNYKYKEDAFAAIRGLQGCFVAGDRLKIEFAKSEKSSSSSVDTNLEPSEVLWIGFPAVLKVDETILRNAFSPFGEIVNITAFPGRSYAFVRFRSLRSACRAKDTLLGNLFGDPRVHICFAKSEYTSRGRNPVEAPSSPDIRPFSRIEASHEKLRHNKRSYENISRVPKLAPPRFITDMESQDPDLVLFQRKGNEKPIIDGASERGFQDLGPELRPPRSVFEHQSSPPRDRGAHFRDYSQLDIPRQGQLYDNAWNLPEDPMLFHESKKPKISFFPHENELPEYYFCDPERVKRELPKIPDYHQLDAYNKNFCYGSFGHEQIPDRAINEKQPFGERSEHWNKPSNGFQTRPVPFPPNHVKWKRPSEELNEPSPNEVWEWEGTIAKRGTPVCRARCSPVGKLLDIILPDFLDCTTKTDIDILAKHYYESVSSWVVTFFPYSDADIASYNELMNYLGKKQKAAVAKIDEHTTLFLVPPSEFSDEVLKVPGKLGISGVILRSENLGPSIQSLHNPIERNDTSYGSSSVAPFPDQGNLGVQNVPFPAKFPTPQPASFEGPDHIARTTPPTINDNRHMYQHNPSQGSKWLADNLETHNAGAGNRATQPFSAPFDSVSREYNSATVPCYADYPPGFSGTAFTGSTNPSHETPPSSSATLRPEQLAQLAASLLGQLRQAEVPSESQDSSPSSHTNQSEVSAITVQQEVQPFQQNSGTHEDGDSNYQKRLQATLKLAGDLLHQLRQTEEK